MPLTYIGFNETDAGRYHEPSKSTVSFPFKNAASGNAPHNYRVGGYCDMFSDK